MRAIFFQSALAGALICCAADAATPSALEAEIKRREAQKRAAEATPPANAADVAVPDQEKAKQVVETVYNT